MKTVKFGDHFERVTLVNQESLPLRGIEHLLSIFGNKRIKKGVETLVISSLCPQNPTQSLSFLSSRTKMGRYLDQASSFRQVDRSITDLGEEDGVQLGVVLESRKNPQPFAFRRPAVNKRLAQLFGVRLFVPSVQTKIFSRAQDNSPRVQTHCRKIRSPCRLGSHDS